MHLVPNAGLTEVLVPAGYVQTAYDAVFKLSPDKKRYVAVNSDTPTKLAAPGLPFSLVFRSEPGKEDLTLKVASAYQAASKRRVSPPAFGPIPGEETILRESTAHQSAARHNATPGSRRAGRSGQLIATNRGGRAVSAPSSNRSRQSGLSIIPIRILSFPFRSRAAKLDLDKSQLRKWATPPFLVETTASTAVRSWEPL